MLIIHDKKYKDDFIEVRKIDSTHVSISSIILGIPSSNPAIYHIAQLVDNENYNEIKSWLDSQY